MGGQGNFSEPRLGIDVKHSPDVVTPKLEALRAYQHSLLTPPVPERIFDKDMAARGEIVFEKSCASCHVGVSGTDNNTDGKLHTAAEIGVDGAYAARTATKGYRTTPLRGLWQHAPFFHDGAAATLEDVVKQYNQVRALGLTSAQQSNLVQFLKSR
jgi:cytochrome c peroxidase